MPLTPEQKRQAAIAHGLNPDEYELDEALGGFVPRTSPVVQPTDNFAATSALKPARVPASALGAGARSFLANIGPTAASIKGGTALAASVTPWLAPMVGAAFPPAAPITVPLTGPAVGLVGALASGWAANKAQEAILPEAATQQLAQDAQDQPWASFAGGLASSLPAVRPGLDQLKTAGSGLANLATKLSGVPTQVTPQQVNALANMAVQSAPPIVRGITDENTTPGMAAVDVIANALLSRPTKLGERVLGMSPDVVDPQMELFDKARVGETPLALDKAGRVEERLAARAEADAQKQERVDREAAAQRAITDPAEAARVAQARVEAEDPNELYKRLAEEKQRTAQIDLADQIAQEQDKQSRILEQQRLRNEIAADAKRRAIKPTAEEVQAIKESSPVADTTEAKRMAQLDAEIKADALAREERLRAESLAPKPSVADQQIAATQEAGAITTRQETGVPVEERQLGITPPDVPTQNKIAPSVEAPPLNYDKLIDPARKFPTDVPAGAAKADENFAARQAEEARRAKLSWAGKKAHMPKFKLVGEQEAKREMEAPATQELFDYFKTLGADFRGIVTQAKGKIVGQNGQQVRGRALIQEGTKDLIAQVSTKLGRGDTVGHEQFHFFWEHLKNSPDATLKAKTEQIRREVEASPEYKAWSQETSTNNVDEFIVQKVGEGMFQRVASKSSFDGLKDVFSSLKIKLNKGTVDDYARLMGRKYLFDPKSDIKESLTGVKSDLVGEQPVRAEQAADEQKEEPTLYTTTTAKELSNPRPFGLNRTREGKVVTNELLSRWNKLNGFDKELTKGFDEWARSKGGQIDPKEAVAWLKAREPKVKVLDYGMSGKESEAKQEYDRMKHEWFEKLSREEQRTFAFAQDSTYTLDGKNFSQRLEAKGWLPETITIAKRYADLSAQVTKERRKDVSPRATGYYKQVSALPVNQPMPSWTKSRSKENVQRVDVVLPYKEDQILEPGWQKKAGLLWEPDGLHENVPNTIGWTMIQYKDGPNGERIALLAEVQSRWGQETYKRIKTEKETRPEILSADKLPTGWRFNKTVNGDGSPLYQLLDADNNVRSISRRTPELTIAQYNKERTETLNNIPNHPLLTDTNNLLLKAAIEQARKEGATHIALSDGETAMLTEMHDQHITRGATIPQEGGMRLNYDKLLPKAAEAITGGKGELVNLGEHKNAFSDAIFTDNSGVATKEPRSNLIFKNADGSPKTSITARLYPLDSVAARREAGEPFSYTTLGYQEAITPKAKLEEETPAWRTFGASQVDKVRALGPKYKEVADAISRFFNRKDAYEAKYLDVPWKEARKFSDKDMAAAMDYAYKHVQGEPLPARPNTEAMRWVQKYFREVAEYQRTLKLPIQLGAGISRERGISEYYAPAFHTDEIKQEFMRNPLSAKSQKAMNDWADYVVKRSGMNREEVMGNIKTYVDALASGVTRTVDFNALTKAQGYGLPDNLREKDPWKILKQYGTRTAKTFAYWQELQSNARVAGMLRLHQPDGKLSPLVEGTESVAGAQDVVDAMRMVVGDQNYTPVPRINAFIRLVNNALMGLPTGLRDLTTAPGIASQYIPVKDWAVLGEAAMKAGDNLGASLATGARNGRLDMKRFRALESPDEITATLNKAAEAFRKYQGRDALEQASRVYTFTVGKLEANIMLQRAKGGDAEAKRWLTQFGELNDAPIAKWGEAELNQVAKNFVDKTQGTFDARGLSSATVDSALSPFITLQKWGIERFNNFRKDVIEPAVDQGEYTPLLKTLFASTLSGVAIQELNELLSGKKHAQATLKEAAQKENKEYLTAAAINVLQMGSFAGILGDMFKAGVDVGVYKQSPRIIGFPAAEVPAELVQAMIDFNSAQENGQPALESLVSIAGILTRRHIQNLNYALNRIDYDGDAARKNAERDLRVFRSLEGNSKPFTFAPSMTGKIANAQERKFKQTEDLQEAATLLPEVLENAKKRATLPDGRIDLARFTQELRNLKTDQDKTIPRDPVEASRYREFIGEDEFTQRAQQSMKKKAIGSVKDSMVPSM